MKFGDEVRKVTLKHLKELKEVNKEIEKLKEQKGHLRTPYYNECLDKLNKKKEALTRNGEISIRKMIEEYKNRIHAEHLPNGEELTADAKLFESSLVLPFNQVNELAEKYKDNRTMSQLINQYAERHKMPIGKFSKTEAERCKDAESMINYYNSVMARPEYSDIWEDDSNEANHFAE